jgi:hypothetical protein
VSEQLLEGRIGKESGTVLAAVQADGAHEHAFVNGVEKTPEGFRTAGVYRDDRPYLEGAFFAGAGGVAGGFGVGVDEPK